MKDHLKERGLLALLMILVAPTFALSQTKQDLLTIDQALKAGKISVVLEGIEGGKSLNLIVTNLSDSNLALVLPKGTLDFHLARATVSVLVENQVGITLERKASHKATLPQVGDRVKEGKVTLRQTADGFETKYEHFLIGAPPP